MTVGDDFNNFNNDFLNMSGNKRVISTAISKLNADNRRTFIQSAHPKNTGYQ